MKKYNCNYCNKIIDKPDWWHKQASNQKNHFCNRNCYLGFKNKNPLSCLNLLNKYPNLTKSLMYDKYINLEWSLPDFKNEYGISYRSTQKLLDYYDIQKRNHSIAKKTKRCNDKTTKTIKQIYGVDNVSKSHVIKKKKAETFLLHYSVDNIFKYQKFIDSIDDKMIQKYGVKRRNNTKISAQAARDWWSKLPQEEKAKRIKNLHSNNVSRNTKIEIMTCDILCTNNFSFIHQFPIKNYYVDFYIKEYDLIIECYGDYWHANPIKYKNEDLIRYPGKGLIHPNEIWKRDKYRIESINNYGYNNVLILWETDIIKNKNNPEWLFDEMKYYYENKINKKNIQ